MMFHVLESLLNDDGTANKRDDDTDHGWLTYDYYQDKPRKKEGKNRWAKIKKVRIGDARVKDSPDKCDHHAPLTKCVKQQEDGVVRYQIGRFFCHEHKPQNKQSGL